MSSAQLDAAATPALRPLGPGSATWRRGIDWRALLGSRAALLLEVAHPVVGAGVIDHSEFLRDRWGRISRTLAAMRRYTGFDGPQAAIDEGQRLRDLHRHISGVDALGRSYHALNADAYLWVHAVAYASAADVRRVFGGTLDDDGEDALFREWRDVATILRIPERVIPHTRAEFWAYYRETVEHRLERNAATELLLELDRHPMPAPPKLRVPQLLWNSAAVPLAALLRLTTAGLLPDTARTRLRVDWSAEREQRFQRTVTVVRALDRALPDRVRYPAAHRTETR
ncbi:oxygenase MpaB family protein [Mycobacterium timonense]|jgi:uncharacterized protein (DUF2236 family)|uniref:ER-bound oxygenase mpaB/mpaB'/Rubber oxygenase catalytic domain-containing protein n=1 Tax=Mycobacterium timonense TaxID=701043 RepID=A0A7I9Z564_9MYCO|nr:oxygenase MpaB family protein [Mycobacterium timonense]GFG96005.1 hypothetical protein MTIM_18840 [Mycobacterium timonense]